VRRGEIRRVERAAVGVRDDVIELELGEVDALPAQMAERPAELILRRGGDNGGADAPAMRRVAVRAELARRWWRSHRLEPGSAARPRGRSMPSGSRELAEHGAAGAGEARRLVELCAPALEDGVGRGTRLIV
jgi:hypothetical protein